MRYIVPLIMLMIACQDKPEDPWNKIVSKSELQQGFLDQYQHRESGDVYLAIAKERLNQDILHFRYVEDGSGVHYVRGEVLDSQVLEFRKDFNKIEVVGKNTRFHVTPGHSFNKGATANISNPILARLDIEAESPDGSQYLVSAKKLFLSEKLGAIKPVYDPKQDNGHLRMGQLDEEATKFLAVFSYPTNANFSINYSYHNDLAKGSGTYESLYDLRKVTVTINHYLVEAPKDNGFVPRLADPRVGYFTQQKDDLVSENKQNFHDLIRKWNLIKKDPELPISEPVKPIVWWIENTTPKKYRAYIKEGALLWNKAFEKAGFKNAMVVKEQPDDASWHANDLAHNVIRFVSSPKPAFGGIGPSFTDPRTGEIIGSDIVLEYIYFTNRHRYAKLYGVVPGSGSKNLRACSNAMLLSEGMQLGKLADAVGVEAVDSEELMRDSIISLVAHEVGHTLGLTHNMAASYGVSREKLASKEATGAHGNTASVMDYESINLHKESEQQGHYYNATLGAYDYWAIEFGYTPQASSREEYQAWRTKILDRSREPALFYGNDADDMRAPGRGIDPRVMIGDLSNDPLGWAKERIEFINGIWPKLSERYYSPDQSYIEYKHAHDTLVGQYRNAVRVMSRYIGGVYNSRLMQGQTSAPAFSAVPYSQQKRAMSYLVEHALGRDVWWSEQITSRLQMQRRGFDFFGVAQDPSLQSDILDIQKEVLDHAMNEVVLRRLANSSFYGNKYSVLEVLTDLRQGIFGNSLSDSLTLVRRNIQSEFLGRLGQMIKKDSKYDSEAQAASIYQIKSIESMLANQNSTKDPQIVAHKLKLQSDIQLIWEARKS